MAMTSRSRPEPGVPLPISDEAAGAVWLVLAADGPASMLAGAVAGMVVAVVADPSLFRERLANHRPRVVVCSRPPAGLGDLQAVAEARRRRPSMRAVLVSPPEAVDARLDALARGFDDALASTMPLDELVGRLSWHEARSRVRPASAGVLRFGEGLELDTTAHELRREGEVVHLRPKEYGLLALLAAHPGRAYTRAELLDRVWGSRRGAGRTVDVHVRWLRSKIELDPDQPVTLVTVRGVGYRLDPVRR
ncbi:MAG: winged helix-turn-helix transcriptional regulator [Candidatus Limnocylindrales bacterium]